MSKLLLGLGSIALAVTACFSGVEANSPQQKKQADPVIPPYSTHMTGLIDPEPIPTKVAKIVSRKPYKNKFAWGCDLTIRYIAAPDHPEPFRSTKCNDIKAEFLTLKELRARYGKQVDDEVEYLITAGKNKRFLVATTPKGSWLYPVNLEGRVGEVDLKR